MYQSHGKCSPQVNQTFFIDGGGEKKRSLWFWLEGEGNRRYRNHSPGLRTTFSFCSKILSSLAIHMFFFSTHLNSYENKRNQRTPVWRRGVSGGNRNDRAKFARLDRYKTSFFLTPWPFNYLQFLKNPRWKSM